MRGLIVGLFAGWISRGAGDFYPGNMTLALFKFGMGVFLNGLI